MLGAKNLTVGSNNLSTTVSGVISGLDGSLTKVGTGTMTLTNTETYTGVTTISAGTLQLGNGGATGSIVGTFSITRTFRSTVQRLRFSASSPAPARSSRSVSGRRR